MGLVAYMNLDALNRLIGEAPRSRRCSIRVDRTRSDALYRHLKEFPRVAVVASKAAMLQNFRETSARNLLFFTAVLTAFAAVIAIGVVYNNARIALQERALGAGEPARAGLHARRGLDVPAGRAGPGGRHRAAAGLRAGLRAGVDDASDDGAVT